VIKENPIDNFEVLVEKCAASEAGARVLGMYDHTIQFSLLDGDPFFFTAIGGKVEVSAGEMPSTNLDNGYEIKGSTGNFVEWFQGQSRMSDLIENGQLFPVASHTTKRHIDYWVAQIVRIGNGIKIPKEVY